MNLEGALLREVARVQHDKTLQAVRDLIEETPTWKRNTSSFSDQKRDANDYKKELLTRLQSLRDDV